MGFMAPAPQVECNGPSNSATTCFCSCKKSRWIGSSSSDYDFSIPLILKSTPETMADVGDKQHTDHGGWGVFNVGIELLVQHERFQQLQTHGLQWNTTSQIGSSMNMIEYQSIYICIYIYVIYVMYIYMLCIYIYVMYITIYIYLILFIVC